MNWSAEVVGLVPFGVVAVTCTVPRACAGAFTVRRFGVCTLTFVPLTVPNATVVPPLRKSVPVTVTVGAHALDSSGAWLGLTLEIVGAAAVKRPIATPHRSVLVVLVD